MFSGLRARLLVSYTAIIALVLCAVTFALLVILRNNPITIRQQYQVLATIARATVPFVEGNPEQVDRRLAQIAESNNVRALRVGEDAALRFDSADQLPVGQPVGIHARSDESSQAFHPSPASQSSSCSSSGKPSSQNGLYR